MPPLSNCSPSDPYSGSAPGVFPCFVSKVSIPETLVRVQSARLSTIHDFVTAVVKRLKHHGANPCSRALFSG
ncbi:hypothetical protein EMIT0347P_10904 [Pseudomonas sp. IT-347P]